MSQRSRRLGLLDAALVAAVLGIAVAAIVNFIQVRGAEQSARPTPQLPPSTTTPTVTDTVAQTEIEETVSDSLPNLVPLPAELREEGGIVWWADTTCQAGSLALSSGTVEQFPQEHCRVWPAPNGVSAATVTKRRAEMLEGRGIQLITEGAAPVIGHTPGFLASEIAWNVDGSSFAVCIGTRNGTVVDIVTPGAGSRTLDGSCFPAWLPDGRLAVSTSRPSLEVGDKQLLDPHGFDDLLPTAPKDATRAVSALAAGGGRLAVALVAATGKRLLPEAAALLVMTTAGEIEFSALLPADRLPTAIGIAPDAGAFWYFDAGRSSAVLVRLPGGRQWEPFDARWFTWSPDGRYLAAATKDGIVMSRWPEGEEVAVLPVQASDVTWTRSP